MSRAAEIAGFLAASGWGDAEVEPMPADFSPRRYARLRRGDGLTAILMDADPDQKTPAFVRIAGLLREAELSAPVLYAEQAPHGLVLMEDFGEANIGRLIDNGSDGLLFYLRAAEVLAQLHQYSVEPLVAAELPLFNAQLFTTQAEKFLDHYVPYALQREASAEEREDFRTAWLETLHPVDDLPQRLLLRDFMPDNVMHLPERSWAQAMGLLDFQDAGMGPIAYDLASFCEVVRRDGGDAFLEEVLEHYYQAARPICSSESLRAACRILSAQRHMRILGILANLAQQGRSEKRAYIPRVEAYVKASLRDESMHKIAVLVGELGVFR